MEATVEQGGIVTLGPEPSSLIQVIARAASDPTVDIEKMQQLLAMKERIDAKNAEMEFNLAMMLCQAEIPAICKDAKNSHTNSRYATLEAVNDKIVPAYTKHGFALSFGTTDSKLEGYIRLTCHVSHTAGHSRDYQADLPLDGAGSQGKANKTGVQAFGSTVSYGRRYLTCLIFNVTLTNEDRDGRPMGQAPDADPDAPEVPTREQRKQIPEMVERGQKLASLFDAYKRNCDPGKDTREAFVAWAKSALKTDADLTKLSCWTDEMIVKAKEACL
jgi:hypothetical protein